MIPFHFQAVYMLISQPAAYLPSAFLRVLAIFFMAISHSHYNFVFIYLFLLPLRRNFHALAIRSSFRWLWRLLVSFFSRSPRKLQIELSFRYLLVKISTITWKPIYPLCRIISLSLTSNVDSDCVLLYTNPFFFVHCSERNHSYCVYSSAAPVVYGINENSYKHTDMKINTQRANIYVFQSWNDVWISCIQVHGTHAM